MEINKIEVGLLKTNCYILKKEDVCLVIDPGEDVLSILNIIGDKLLVGIIITHRHFDHVGALDELLFKKFAKVYDISNLDEKQYKIGPFEFEVIHTLGHTNDSITLYFRKEKIMFTGDFLFKDTIGRTDLPNSSEEEMLKSIKKVKKYEHDIIIYPGHGESSNLGHEFNNNPFLK